MVHCENDISQLPKYIPMANDRAIEHNSPLGQIFNTNMIET